jgi:pantothenate kinase type III
MQRNTLRLPYINIYIVSTNKKHLVGIQQLFQDVPCNLFQLQASDFFPSYPTMGVDRLAALLGAISLGPPPVLVVDGGTAMTYTGMNAQGVVVGGGISPGLHQKFKALSIGALPLLTTEQVQQAVEEAKKTTSPIPTFANNTQDAMLSSVLGETVRHVCGVIGAWKEQEELETPRVILAGGDGQLLYDLLQPDHSGILETTCEIPQMDLQHKKQLIHLGLAKLLSEKKPQPDKRHEILGQRVARRFSGQIYYGTVIFIDRGKTLDQDFFKIFYDDGDMEDLHVRDLYEALSLYVKKGGLEDEALESKLQGSQHAMDVIDEATSLKPNKVESDETMDEEEEQHMEEEAQGEVESEEPAVEVERESEEEEPEPEKEEEEEEQEEEEESEEEYESTEEPPSKRHKPAVATKRVHSRYIGRRIAKQFGDLWYFGTVDEHVAAKDSSDGIEFWRCVYDDGDREDYEVDDLEMLLEFYEEHKEDDVEQEKEA